MVSTKVLSFATDENDLFTLENYKGTTYEIKTLPKTVTDSRRVLLKGVEQLEFPVALGTRKTKLNVGETVFLQFAKFADKLTNTFGGRGNYAAKVKGKINLLKMSSDLVSVPKLMRLNNSLNLAADYRSTWNAKYLYDNYHSFDSFVLHNNRKQYEIFEKIRMEASFQDFLDVIGNNIGTMADGRKVEFSSILYNFGGGYWEADFRAHKVYAKNLKEIYNEPK
jgi:hypothetical protein